MGLFQAISKNEDVDNKQDSQHASNNSDNDYQYDLTNPQGELECLQIDTANGTLVGKFSDSFNLFVFNVQTDRWELPETVKMFGESNYDRAYYLGQGCWERMKDAPEELKERMKEIGRNGNTL